MMSTSTTTTPTGIDPAQSAATLATLRSLLDAIDRRDIDGMMALLTDDCVFENTSPAPDGERIVGKANLREWFTRFQQASPEARFSEEEIVPAGDRVTVRWRYDWTGPDGAAGHVRGMELFRVRDGKVCEMFAYVKG